MDIEWGIKVKLLKKDYLKSTMIISIIWILVVIILMGIIQVREYQTYQYNLNQMAGSIIEAILQQYPEQEKEIIQILQKEPDKQMAQKGIELMKKYGIDPYQGSIVKQLENSFNQNTSFNIICISILGLGLMVIFIIFLYRRERSLKQIAKYLEDIGNKKYLLDINDNTEGELSNLKNQIYKITIMLRKQAEESEKSKKSLADSLSDISHQLKTPLTSISVMVDVLKENKNISEEKRQEYLFEITRVLEWINWLVISLLKLSKLDAGTVVLKQEKVNVKKLAQNVQKNVGIPLEIKEQELVIKGNDEVSFIGDFEWSVEALTNIVKNGIEHSKEGEKIEISFSENTLYTQIIVKDNGQGIAKEDLPHIFQRFYKCKNSSKESVGIGLSLAKAIIQKQNGDISVNSKEGQGTEFIIKLYKGII